MSFIYKIFKEKLMDGTFGSMKNVGTLRVALATSVPAETDTGLPTVTGTAITLVADQTATGGAFGANSVVFTGVPSGVLIRGLIIYKQGTPNIPIIFLDQGVGLPQVSDGSNIPVAFPTTGNKIFTL